MSFSYAIALTGSIATGKSSAAKLLTQMGFALIDADEVAHRILNEQKDAVATLFGAEVIDADEVNRQALGAIVFSDAHKRESLEALLHPLIYERIETMSERLDAHKRPYLVDIPLFFEGKRYPIKKVLVVYTPEATQLTRLMQRNNFSNQEAKERMAIQISIEEKVKNADYVIDNSGTLAALKEECYRVKEKIEKDFQ